ncbi:MAG: hypothetical protein IPN76_03270 [Saprospiraceae bacterium]|nr:hypothetical protein [Saprospiraceae bacterium]
MRPLNRYYSICFLFFLLTIGGLPSMHAQRLTWMPTDQKLKKLMPLTYVGTEGGYIVAHSDGNLLFLDAEKMTVKRTIDTGPLSVNKGDRYLGVIKTERGWVALVQSFRMLKKDSDYELKTALLTDKGFDAPQPWLHIPREDLRENAYVAFSFEVSENGKYILVPMNDKATGKPKRIVYGADFKELYSAEIPETLNHKGKKLDLVSEKEFVDNDGNFYLTGILEEKQKGLDDHYPFVYKYDRASGKGIENIFEVKGGTIAGEGLKNYVMAKKTSALAGKYPGEVIFQLNNQAGLMLVAGLYGNETGGGVFLAKLDTKNTQVSPIKEYTFPDALIKKIEKESYEGKEIKGSVHIQDILVKENKELICLLEIDRSKSGARMATSGHGINQTQSMSSTLDIETKDVVYMNFGLNGDLTFFGNISKSQSKVADIDELSFAAACVKNDIHIVFLEGEKKEKTLFNFTIGEDGKLSKKELTTFLKGTMVLPSKIQYPAATGYDWIYDQFGGLKYPVQISPNELLVRAKKDDKPTMVKITY